MSLATETKPAANESGTTATPPTGQSTQSDPPSEPKATTGGVVAEPLHEIPVSVDPLLVKILSWPRRDGSFQELQFCKFLREHVGYIGALPAKEQLAPEVPSWTIMSGGCLAVTVPRPSSNTLVGGEVVARISPSTTLFSCHVDTIEGWGDETSNREWKDAKWVAKPAAPSPDNVDTVLRKSLTYDPNFGLIGLEKDSIGGSLGADDGAGVWLMLKMIERRVPGTYVFHRSEEVGGKGSAAMRDKHDKWLEKFEAAIAFDRHDTYEVIHTQGGSKCASMKFTEALCARLNSKGMRYEPSSRGVFTDTKNYRTLIPECVNVAVGYHSQHGRNETLDYGHLSALLDAVCAIDWDSLPIDRDQKAYEAPTGGYYGGQAGYGRNWMNRGHAGVDDLFDDPEDYGFPASGGRLPVLEKPGKTSKKKQRKQQQQGVPPQSVTPQLTVSDEMGQFSLEEIEAWAVKDPEGAAKAIGQLLVEVTQLKATVSTAMMLLGWKEDA